MGQPMWNLFRKLNSELANGRLAMVGGPYCEARDVLFLKDTVIVLAWVNSSGANVPSLYWEWRYVESLLGS